MIEIVALTVCAAVGAVLLFSAAVWLLAQAERYDAADEIRERNRAIAGRPDDLAGLNVFDGGWDD